MHELYTLQQVAVEGYATYNFPKGVYTYYFPFTFCDILSSVMSALGHFANITLSSLYFDITKDCLYANSTKSFERRAVVTVLEQVGQVIRSTFVSVIENWT
jgi:isoleucyl-tRNA synthetase